MRAAGRQVGKSRSGETCGVECESLMHSRQGRCHTNAVDEAWMEWSRVGIEI
jgi:hypothetical protein